MMNPVTKKLTRNHTDLYFDAPCMYLNYQCYKFVTTAN